MKIFELLIDLTPADSACKVLCSTAWLLKTVRPAGAWGGDPLVTTAVTIGLATEGESLECRAASGR